MKTLALKRFRARLAKGDPVCGLWVTLESATITEMAVALGLDWVVIAAEHGHLDWKDINEHIRAGLRRDTVVLVRLAERSTTLTKRALDIGAERIDCFNAKLVPGIEMSGGFARFQPGGTLPAHLHDFDESICITDGDANYLVEGRRYSLNACATAMIPRGRVHHIVNSSASTMDMIWACAGPVPERIMVDEACGTKNRNAWSCGQ